MNGSLKWKLIVGFVLVFIAGGALGIFIGASQASHFFGGPHRPGFLAERMRSRLRWQLHLTDEQLTKISPIIDKTASELEDTRNSTAHKVHEIFAEAHREMAPLLTPEQRQTLMEIQQRRQRLHHHGRREDEPSTEQSPTAAPETSTNP